MNYARRFINALPFGGVFDDIFIFLMFFYAHRRIPRRSSMLFNDYLYFLKSSSKISDILRQITSDKIMVKDFVRQRCGDALTVDTIAVFENVDEIDISSLQKPCVLKPTHSSGTVVFIRDGKEELTDVEDKALRDSLRSSPYKSSREGNYRYLRPRIICEPMLPLGEGTKDYKFFCYRGEPRLVQVDSNRHVKHMRNVYSADWTPLQLEYNFPLGEWEPKPACLPDMIRIARSLAAPFEFVRIDFFIVENAVFVGEVTHCPESAHGRFSSREDERVFSQILFQAGRDS